MEPAVKYQFLKLLNVVEEESASIREANIACSQHTPKSRND